MRVTTKAEQRALVVARPKGARGDGAVAARSGACREGVHARRRRARAARRRRSRRERSGRCSRSAPTAASRRLPRRGGARSGHRVVHGRPPPRVRREPSGLGAPRHRARRSAHGPDGHAAVLPAHDRGGRTRRRRRRGHRSLAPGRARCGGRRSAFLFIDGGHAEDVAMADYEAWSPHVAAAVACWRSTTCSKTRRPAGRPRSTSGSARCRTVSSR